MIIADYKTIKAIQKEFHEKFPGLKIEFYAGHHKEGEGSPETEKIDPNALLKDLRTIESATDFTIDPDSSVAEFEQQFYRQFGLNVQVFRKSGNLWMQTTSTDQWSLSRQNRKGNSSEQHYKEMYE
jgi:hypothetical protein